MRGGGSRSAARSRKRGRAVGYSLALGLWMTPLGAGCGDDELDREDGGSSVGGSLGAGGEGGIGGALAGGATSGGAGGDGGSGAAPADGSWDHPYVIDELPYEDSGTTSSAIANVANAYFPCAPDTAEAGPEVVYRVTVPEVGWLDATVTTLDEGADLDVHLLAAPDPDACVTRGDVHLGAPVTPGTYWLVVDTWSDAELAGAYSLEVDLIVGDGDDCFVSPVICDEQLPPFVNLVGREAPGDPGCLPGMARVDDFCVDRYEAIVVSFSESGWLPLSPYAHPPDDATLAALSIESTYPQGHISQLQAAEACSMASKRLCDDDEWLRACRGASASTYPYGDELLPGACNDARDCHPVIQYFESTDAWIWSELGHPCIGQLPAGLDPTGHNANCFTEEGIFDMMGNLHEWTSDPAGTFRGGFYVDTVVNGPGCLYATTAHSVAHHDYSTGFRCCADAVP